MNKKEKTQSVEALVDSGVSACIISYDLAVKLDIEIVEKCDATLKDLSDK